MKLKKLKKVLKKTMQTESILRELIEEKQVKSQGEYPTSTDVSGAYAVIWDYEKEGTKITRAGLAENFEDPRPALNISEKGSSPFDEIMPWAGMRRSVHLGANSVNDIMVTIPEFWYTAIKDEANHRWIWAVSPAEKEGYCKHPGSGREIGAYHTSRKNGTVASAEGEIPLTDTTWDEFKKISSEKGEGWGMMDIATWSAVQILYLIEFADFDSVKTLGTGYKSDEWELGRTGDTGEVLYHTMKASGASNKYRNIEDPFSNCLDWIDGFRGNRNGCKVNDKKTGFGLASDGWIANFGYSTAAPWAFIPSESTDDEDAHIPDYTWSWPKGYGKRPAFVGGSYSSYRSCGLFYFNAGNLASGTGADLGSRLQKT